MLLIFTCYFMTIFSVMSRFPSLFLYMYLWYRMHFNNPALLLPPSHLLFVTSYFTSICFVYLLITHCGYRWFYFLSFSLPTSFIIGATSGTLSSGLYLLDSARLLCCLNLLFLCHSLQSASRQMPGGCGLISFHSLLSGTFTFVLCYFCPTSENRN